MYYGIPKNVSHKEWVFTDSIPRKMDSVPNKPNHDPDGHVEFPNGDKPSTLPWRSKDDNESFVYYIENRRCYAFLLYQADCDATAIKKMMKALKDYQGVFRVSVCIMDDMYFTGKTIEEGPITDVLSNDILEYDDRSCSCIMKYYTVLSKKDYMKCIEIDFATNKRLNRDVFYELVAMEDSVTVAR